MGIPVYEIVPSPLYGWNFKNSESRHILKFAKEKTEIINYAVSFCKTHESELVIYNYSCEREKTMSFEVNSKMQNIEKIFL